MALVGLALVVIILVARRRPPAPVPPVPAPTRAVQEVQSLTLTGLTTEQQVAALREATVHLAESLVARFPQEAEAHVLLGDVHRRFGRSAEAVTCWQHALKIDPRRISAYDRIAIVEMEKGRFEEAISLWRQVLTLDPSSPGVHDKLGRVLMASGQQDEAIAALMKEIHISPTSARTYCLLGQAHLQKNRYEQAIGHYEKALALDPNLSDACYGLATAHARLGQPEKAKSFRAMFRELSARAPQERPYGFTPEDDLLKARADFINHALRAASQWQAENQTAVAAALLEQAVAVDPNHVGGRKRLAALYRGVGRLTDALRQCEHVARLEPKDPTCQLLIGGLALQLKQPDKAESAFRKLVTLAPEEPVGYLELARLYLGADRNLEEARRLAEKAVALAPVAANYFLLGQVCYRTGALEAAVVALRQAVRLDPGNAEYQRVYNMIEMRR